MAVIMRVHKSRGAASGVLLILLGAWGALVPFVGPYAHFAYTPDRAWAWSSGRFWLEVLPAAATLLGGLIVLLTRLRPVALFGALIAALSGAWFAVDSALAPLWSATSSQGTPVGGPVARAMEQIAFFTGVGALIVLTASVAMGRLAMISTKDMRAAARRAEGKVSPPDAVAMGDISTDDSGTADMITPTVARHRSDPRGWRLAGRAGADPSGFRDSDF